MNKETERRSFFWDSKNGRDLFSPDEGEPTSIGLHWLITMCEEMADKSRGTETSIKYLLLRKSYILALALMNKCIQKQCCSNALQLFQSSGFKVISNMRTIMRWHRHFRVNRTLSPVTSKQTKEFEPKLFSVYPEAKIAVNEYFSNTLGQ
jgi:hypothetical protein